MTITEDAMTTIRTTDGALLTLTPAAMASGRYRGTVVETIPVRSRPVERRWCVR